MKKFFTKNNEAVCSPLVGTLISMGDKNNCNQEPSPEFVSSSQLTNKFYPLTKREGKRNRNKLINLSTYRLIDFKIPAFTLAEVLITLGVIGIIAILTIPSTVKNYKNKLYVSQLKKVYSQLTDATTSMVNDEHANNFYETTGGVKNSCSDADKGTCEKGPGYFLTTYLKNIKVNCKTGTKTCLANTYNSADGKEIKTIFGDYCVQTTNGASICMAYDEESNFDKILVDVNGTSEPNIIGKDVFVMKVKTDGSITDLSSDEDDCNKGSTDDEDARTDVEKYASGCLTKVINAGWQINDEEQKEEEPSGD